MGETVEMEDPAGAASEADDNSEPEPVGDITPEYGPEPDATVKFHEAVVIAAFALERQSTHAAIAIKLIPVVFIQ